MFVILELLLLLYIGRAGPRDYPFLCSEIISSSKRDSYHSLELDKNIKHITEPNQNPLYFLNSQPPVKVLIHLRLVFSETTVLRRHEIPTGDSFLSTCDTLAVRSQVIFRNEMFRRVYTVHTTENVLSISP